MKIHLIAGARPNIMKVAPLYRRLAKLEEFEVQLVAEPYKNVA